MRAVSNPPNPWHTVHAEWLGEPPQAQLEVFEENARTIIAENDSPDVGFRFSVNPYRGCFHACSYCQGGETPILMADGRTKLLADLRIGDEVFGTALIGRYRRFVKTSVLDHWSTIKPAYRIELEDGTTLVASADHRFLTQRGWKHVVANFDGRGRQRPYLTSNNHLLGTGHFAQPPEETDDYRAGYLCGMIRGDAHRASYTYFRDSRRTCVRYKFGLALVDFEALLRARAFLQSFGVPTLEYLFQAAVGA